MRSRASILALLALVAMGSSQVPGSASPGVEVRAVGLQASVGLSVVTGSVLTPGAVVRVTVGGLPAELAKIACVSVRARPRGTSGDGQPLFTCASGSCIPLQGFPDCGVARGYDPLTGTGGMEIPWTANQHLRGSYQIRAEVLLSYTDSMWGLWQRTDWVDVTLSVEPRPCQVVLDSPGDGASFISGEHVALVGRVITGLRLQGLYAQVTRVIGAGEAQLSTWVTSPGRLYPDGRFETIWDTEGLPAGLYRLQVICTTSDGVSIPSQVVTLSVVESPCQVVLDSPGDGASFISGEHVALVGRVITGLRLQGLSVQVTRIPHPGVATSGTWVTSPGRLYPDGRFETIWDTKGLSAGLYRLQVICTTSTGVSVPGQPVTVSIRPECQYGIMANGVLVRDGEPIEVNAGEHLQFCLFVPPLESQCEPGSLRWEFADGQESLDRCPRHVYHVPGQYTLRLTVFEHPGLKGTELLTATCGIAVRARRPAASGTREVLGFLDPCAGLMTVLPGTPVFSRIQVETSEALTSLAIHEILPNGWAVSSRTLQPADGELVFTIAPMHRTDETSQQGPTGESRYTWLVFPRTGTLPAGTDIEIIYELIPPPEPSGSVPGGVHLNAVSLRGLITTRTAEGTIQDHPVRGDVQLSIVDLLTIPVAVAHLVIPSDPDAVGFVFIEARRFGPGGESPTYLITAEQMEKVKHLWQTWQDVRDWDIPFTGRRLTYEDMMRLSDYFAMGIPVTRCIE